jgi:hypothetical protein
LLLGKVNIGIESILSLQACEFPDKKMFLAVSGSRNLLEEETDIYVVMDLTKSHNYYFHNQQEIRNMDKNHKKKFCDCGSKKIIEKLLIKLDHYLEELAGKTIQHFKQGFHSKFGRSLLLLRY